MSHLPICSLKYGKDGGYFNDRDLVETRSYAGSVDFKAGYMNSFPFYSVPARNQALQQLLIGPHVFLQQYKELATLYPGRVHNQFTFSATDLEWRVSQLDDTLRRLIENGHFFTGRFVYPQAVEASGRAVLEDENTAILTSWDEEKDVRILQKKTTIEGSKDRTRAEALYSKLIDQTALLQLTRVLMGSDDVFITRQACFVLGEHLVEWIRTVIQDALVLDLEERNASNPMPRTVLISSLRNALRLNKCSEELVSQVKEDREANFETLRQRVLEKIAELIPAAHIHLKRERQNEKRIEDPREVVYSDAEEERVALERYDKRMKRKAARKKERQKRDRKRRWLSNPVKEPATIPLNDITDYSNSVRMAELNELMGENASDEDLHAVEKLGSEDVEFIDDDLA